MTENKDVCEADLLRLNTNKTKGNLGSFYSGELDDIPPSLISYFETSKSRAAVCEKLILDELQDNKTETEKDFPLNVGDRRPEREKPHQEQLQETEQRQQREMDFQEELRRITEAEQFQQMELELRKRNAQEKLEQELQLQQELLCNFKKQVEKERMMIVEEERRKSEEEAKIREKEERRKKEEEDQRKRREENQRGIDVRLQKERERRVAEETRKQEEAENRKRKQDKNTEEDRRRRENEEMRRLAAQGQRKKKEEETKMEEKRCFMVIGKKMMMEDEERKRDQVTLKDELNTIQEKDDEETRLEEDLRISSLYDVGVNQEEMRKEEEDEERDNRKTLENEMQHRESEDKRKMDNWKSLCLESELLLRKKEETGRGKEIGQRLETVTQSGGEEQRNIEQEAKIQQEMKGSKEYEREKREGEDLEKTEDEKKIQEELKDPEEKDDNPMKDNVRKSEEVDRAEKDQQVKTADDGGDVDAKTDLQLISGNSLEENKGENDVSESQKSGRTGQQASPMPDPTHSEATAKHSIYEAALLRHPDDNISDTSALQTVGQIHPESQASASSCSLPASLPEHTELKRLSWMEHCVSWSELSLQNKRKERGSSQSQRTTRRADGLSTLVPLCPRTLLESTGTKSLQEVTTVALEDLAPCSLSTLAQCDRLQSLTLRRCGLRSLESISQLQELCYMDLGENEISFLNFENMGSLRVLRLAHNKLTSIHGLNGAHSLDVLDLSHNSITRIAGLESMRRLQRLFVDHNQLISTKGLRDVYTLHHLDCSHNHLANVEGLENSALLHTLDLRSNSLSEPPSLNNQVLLRELLLDDNNISSLHGLAGCWLPLLLHLSVAQNRITQLPSMTDFVSLKNLDLRFNCLSELQNVCENLEGCVFLQEVHLTGNPLQQETDWKFRLQKAVAGLKTPDGQQTPSSLSLATDSFLMLCQLQLQQTQDLQQRLSTELRNASSSLDAMKSCCHHFTQALQLAEDQRFAHEYGGITVSAGQAKPEKPPDMDGRSQGKLTDSLKTESSAIRPPDNLSRNQPGRSEDTPDEKSPQDTFGSVTTGQRSTAESNVARGFVDFLPSNGERTSTSSDMGPDDLDSKNVATVLQRMQRTSGEKCGHAEASDIRGEAEKPLSELSVNNMKAACENHAATVIQAFWRGCALRRRLASALAAFTCPDTGEDDTFEELDVEEFVVDESALEELWTMTFSEDSPPMHQPVTEQHLPPQVELQAWEADEKEEEVEDEQNSLWSSTSKTKASTLIQNGLSERSEKILQEWGFTNSHTAFLMLKRAQKMKATKKQQKKHGNPFAFSGCNYQISPVEARNRTSRRSRQTFGVGEAQVGLRRAERQEQMRRQQDEQQLKTQVTLRERQSERGQFLPEIKPSILSRGTVQVAACGAQPKAIRLCSSSSLTAPLGKVNRSNMTCAGKDALPPRRVTSPVVKKERISFRDNPVQLSGGWGGGKKRDRLPKK
ncbi:leucine-rich repeat and IQ domain-containing protein 1 isoform X3 [Poecilia formosa]|uniref:leucine-rich repeat and IQ domain-containing protein 1 isoform X3 n=1 Tax=Poecilia formosa TaxID=48698 RepID=UPI0007B8BED7|nr:PREDICTED: leucine-rich repeat and IQ domain-containing protein 1 isoform X3 [Poecilia formosa]